MTLRENLAFIFFLIVLFLLVTRKHKPPRDWASSLSYSLAIGLFLAATLISHSFTPMIAYGIVFLELFLFLFKDGKTYALELGLALLFSLLLAAPYMQLIISFFDWQIRNQFLSRTETSILLIVLISFLGLFIPFYKKLRKLSFLEKYKKAVFLILAFSLILCALIPTLFPSFFSSKQSITLDVFAISIVPLALLGFISAFWISIPSSIISFSFITVLLVDISNTIYVTAQISIDRMAVYISWLLSYGAILGLNSIHRYYRKPKLDISIRLRFGRKLKNIGSSLSFILMILLLISPMIVKDFQTPKVGSQNYVDEDFHSTTEFLTLLEAGDIVVPQRFTNCILLYEGVDPKKLINDKKILQELYSTRSLQNFSNIIRSNYPNASRAQVFLLKRFIGLEQCTYPAEQFLMGVGDRHEVANVLFYTIPLSYSEKELLKSPINATFPVGGQWLFINLTGMNLSEGEILSLRINSNATKKFIVKIKDIHENSTEKITFTLEAGENFYYIRLSEIEEVLDLKNPGTLAFCFSWYYHEPSIDIIITNMTLIMLES